MKQIVLIVLLVAILINSANSLSFKEYIEVDKGLLYTKTGSEESMVNDQINSNGTQSYERQLDMQKETTILKSKYNLEKSEISDKYSYNGRKTIKIGGYDGDDYYNEERFIGFPQYNTYAIKMESANGLTHFVNVKTKSTITADNTIKHNNKTGEISTDFKIGSGWGDVYEGIFKRDTRQHPLSIAESRIHGQVNKLESNITDVELKPVSETQFQLEKLESVEAFGEIGREEHSVPRTKATIETSDGKIEIEKQDKTSRVFGDLSIDVSKIKPMSTGAQIDDGPSIKVRGVILVGKFVEDEQDNLISVIEKITGEDAVDTLEVKDKASGYVLANESDGVNKDQKNYMDAITKTVSKNIVNARGLILLGDFDQSQEDLKVEIENVLPDQELIYLATKEGDLGQATSFALVRDQGEYDNLDLTKKQFADASAQALNRKNIDSTTEERLSSITEDLDYGLIGRTYEGETAELEKALKSVEECMPPKRAIIGDKGTLCRVPGKLQLGRVGRTDDYFKGVIKEI